MSDGYDLPGGVSAAVIEDESLTLLVRYHERTECGDHGLHSALCHEASHALAEFCRGPTRATTTALGEAIVCLLVDAENR